MRSAKTRRLSDGRQLLIGFGLMCMVAAPFAVLLTLQDRDALLAFRRQAVAAQATVIDHSQRSQGYTDHKGRARSKQVYEVSLAYDIRRSVPLGELARRPQGELIAPVVATSNLTLSRLWYERLTVGDVTAPVVVTSKLRVSSFWYERLTVGRSVPVTWVPDRPTDVRLAEQVVFRSSAAYAVGWWLGGFAVFGLGLGLVVVGWRGRPTAG